MIRTRVAGEQHRAFDDRVRLQLVRDLTQRASAVLELHHRGPRHDPQGAILRQLGDQRFRHAVHDVVGFGLVGGEILQRQDRDARPGRELGFLRGSLAQPRRQPSLFRAMRQIAGRLKTFGRAAWPGTGQRLASTRQEVAALACRIRSGRHAGRRPCTSAAIVDRETPAAGRHFVENAAQREDVAASVGDFAAGLLGRHVAERAHDPADLGHVVRRRLHVARDSPGARGRSRES